MPPATKTKQPFTIVDGVKPDLSDRAHEYEKKIQTFLGAIFKGTVENPNTVADAALILDKGDDVAEAWGQLADKDPRVRKILDYVTSPTDNPYAAAVAVTIPFVLQILRNHESDTEIQRPFTFRIFRREFRWNMRFKFKIRNPFFRAVTSEPFDLTHKVFSNEDIALPLAANDIHPAVPEKWARRMQRAGGNGHSPTS